MTPIFVPVKDRLTCLKHSVRSWINQIEDPVEVVFIDQGSTWGPTLKFLNKAPNVYWNKVGKTSSSTFWKNWPAIIEAHMASMEQPSGYYIISDPDVMLDNVKSDILQVFVHILKNTEAACVGPMLKIADIPDYYPLKKQVIKRQKDFWQPPIKKIKFKDEIVRYKHCAIDTTFAMYRADFKFKRLVKNAIRVFAPYSAKHLDWYINPANVPLDQIYYMQTSDTHGNISHWSGKALKEKLL